jgi:L-aspartate oxidase
VLSRAAGVLRDPEELINAIAKLLPLALSSGPTADPASVGLMILVAALERRESRGAHCRTDFFDRDDAQAQSRAYLLEDAIQAGCKFAPSASRQAIQKA